MKHLKILSSFKKYDKSLFNKKLSCPELSSLIFKIYKKHHKSFTFKDKNKIKYIFDFYVINKINILKKSMKVDFMSLREIHNRGIIMNWYDNYQINYNVKEKLLNFLLYLRGFEYLTNNQIHNILKNNYFLNVLCWNEKKFRQYFKQK